MESSIELTTQTGKTIFILVINLAISGIEVIMLHFPIYIPQCSIISLPSSPGSIMVSSLIIININLFIKSPSIISFIHILYILLWNVGVQLYHCNTIKTSWSLA